MQLGTITIPGYEIRERISQGTHSSAYRGVRLADQLPVIIKAPTAKFISLDLSNRFRNEYNIGAQFDSDYVVKYYLLAPYQNGLAIVSEDFGGVKLSAMIPEKGMELQRFLDVAVDITAGIEVIHRKHVIHKDLKPDNIAILPQNYTIKYLDFGISTQAELESFQGIELEASGGTLEYISPEQTGRTNRLIDYRSDLYSLGITLYQMICGSVPFSARDPLELIHSHIAKLPVSPCKRRPDIAPVLSDIILKLLQKNAEDRYQSAAGLAADLKHCRDAYLELGAIPDFELGKADMTGKFKFSQKLYGREPEIRQLLDTFERASQGKSEMLLVSGYSGIGKSALVGELQKSVAGRHGYFICGSYDKLNKGKAYSAIVQAFQSLIQLILGESELRISAWKEELLASLGENAQIIIDVIPAVANIIGPQAAASKLGPVETKNRFDLAFSKFVRVFARHHLVLFLDDIHDADLASINLLKRLATDAEQNHFMLVCTYRDTEVEVSHPFALAIEEIEKSGCNIARISLRPLDLENTRLLIADALGSTAELLAPVAAEVYRKTDGNPFFVKMFLQTICEDQLLKFVPPGGWQWDMAQIRAMQATDNVAELMLRKLSNFPEQTRNTLKLAACLGSTWEIETLALVAADSQAQIREDLQPVLSIGMIIQGGRHFNFVHDRIYEAAYSLIKQPQGLHLHIGEILLQFLSDTAPIEAVIAALSHLNIASPLLLDTQKKFRVARLNLLSGQHSKKNTAYATARQYFNAGIAHLPDNAWEVEYPLCFSLHKESAEAEYLNGDYQKSQQIIAWLLQKNSPVLCQLELYGMLIYQYTVTADYQKGIDTGRAALQLLGIQLPDKALEAVLHAQVWQAKANLGDRQIEALINSPEMVIPEHQAAMRILMEIQPAAYMADPQLYSVIAAMMTNLSLTYGHAHESAKGYVSYAHVLSSVLHDYHTGNEFCRLGLKMSERYADPVQKCRGSYIYTAFLLHWTQPFKEGDGVFEQGYQAGVASGDLLYAGYLLGFAAANLYNKGMRLERLSRKLEQFMDFVKKAQHQMPIDTIQGFQLAIANLSGLTGDKLCFDIEGLSEKQFVHSCKAHNLAALCYFLTLQAQVHYLHKNFEQALSSIVQAENIIDHIRGTSTIAEYNFYHSLILAALYPAKDALIKKQYLQRIEQNQVQMKCWADNCADNFLHKYLLVEAEIARITGRDVDAIRGYDLAISAAVNSDFIQNEALANELAAGFWFGFGKEDFAHLYLIHASRCYQHWGASALAEEIMRVHALPVSRAMQSYHAGTSTAPHASAGFDVASILKASQAISGEIILGRLLEKSMEIVIENAGAQRGCLIMKENNQLIIASKIDVARDKECHLLSIPVEASQSLAKSIVHYVNRTKQCIVLGDAASVGIFTQDPYVLEHKLKSILCMPVIKLGEIFAILYLENDITTVAFTPGRLQTLNLIATQIGVSIENAQLYQNIEKKVEERTHQLQEKSELLSIAGEVLEQANQEMVSEIEQRKLLEEELRKMATTDYLTGLSIRRQIFEQGEKEISRAKRTGTPLSLMMLDIDHFKAVNDTYGHAIGDEVLKAFAVVFRNSLRNIDIVCRYGGEEFVAILPNTDIHIALDVAQRLRRNVEASAMQLAGGELKYTVSIGLAGLSEADALINQLIKRADDALYQAKNSGRNQVVVG